MEEFLIRSHNIDTRRMCEKNNRRDKVKKKIYIKYLNETL